MEPEIEIYHDLEQLSAAAAERVARAAQAAIGERAGFHLALSGGSTPRPTHELLSKPPYSARIDWGRMHVYWGDERCVPSDHPDSNYAMARETLLDRVSIPPDQIHRMPGEREDRDAAARAYEAALPPRLDLMLLGMGADGHTASLFPGSAALEEKARRVVAVESPAQPPWRLTVTPGVIGAARDLLVLVSGQDKAPAAARALEGPESVRDTPAQLARHGVWLLDREAASALSRAAQ